MYLPLIWLAAFANNLTLVVAWHPIGTGLYIVYCLVKQIPYSDFEQGPKQHRESLVTTFFFFPLRLLLRATRKKSHQVLPLISKYEKYNISNLFTQCLESMSGNNLHQKLLGHLFKNADSWPLSRPMDYLDCHIFVRRRIRYITNIYHLFHYI